MARPFSDLPRALRRIRERIFDIADTLVQSGASAGGAAAVRATPVDTGRARSNWVASKNSPFTGVIPPYAPGQRLGIAEQANANAAIAQHASVIGTFNSRTDTGVIIRNNVPYIGGLNDGTISRQGSGMVEKGGQAAIVAIKKAFKTRAGRI